MRVLVLAAILIGIAGGPVAGQAGQKLGSIDVTVLSIHQLDRWDDPQNPRQSFNAPEGGVIIVAKLSLSGSTTARLQKLELRGPYKLRDASGSLYESLELGSTLGMIEPGVWSWQVLAKFILPRRVALDSLVIQGKEFDIRKLEPLRSRPELAPPQNVSSSLPK